MHFLMTPKNVFFFLTGILLTLASVFLLESNVKKPTETPLSAHTQGIISEIREVLDDYKPSPPNSVLNNALLHSFVSSYDDPFTSYLSPEEMLSFSTMIEGDFEWIGAYIEEWPEGVYIAGVLPWSPAQEGGLLPGDLIRSVNGETLHMKSAEEAVAKIRWPAWTTVVLDIFSSILATKKQVTLIRRELEIPIITDELVDKTLLISLFSFNDHSGEDVEEVLKKYNGKYSSILLDLRNNGGGTLQAAVDVWSLFLGPDRLIATVEWGDVQEYVSYGKTEIKIPLFVLVNAQTASAAEILASALHEHLKAPIFGSQTYGKWSVQELFPLSNGGQLKVTTAHWRTASGDLLDGVWITPNTVLLPTAEDISHGKDVQLEKALAIVKSTQK